MKIYNHNVAYINMEYIDLHFNRAYINMEYIDLHFNRAYMQN